MATDGISIEGRNALVTGSTRGIGQQIAKGLARHGCNVIVHGRTMENCSHTLSLLDEYNVKTYAVHGELSEKEGVDNILSMIGDLGLSIDILYNNAAIMTSYRKNIWTHSREDWIKTFKVNVIAMYELCSALIPGMVQRGYGRIVNLTSRINQEPELAPYGASKWAVDKLTDDLASKLGGTGVRINYLDPGWLRTDLGGPNADHPVEAVLPGALVPVLIPDDGPNGEFFSAIEWSVKVG